MSPIVDVVIAGKSGITDAQSGRTRIKKIWSVKLVNPLGKGRR